LRRRGTPCIVIVAMRWRLVPIGLAAALGAVVLAQQPETEPPADLSGHWAGSAKFQTDGTAPCRYEGGVDPPSLVVELHSDGTGRLRLNLEAPAGTSCPPVVIESPVADATLTPTTARFKDSAGREWDLALQAGALRGLFSGTDGSGELSLQRRRAGQRAAAAAKSPEPTPTPGSSPSPSASPSPSPAAGPAGSPSGTKGPGKKSRLLGFVGANIVALGALLANSHATQDKSTGTSAFVCSPRSCLIGAPGEPCDCTSTITTGQDCGQTTGGVPVRGACALPNLPCQALLSCNNGVCEDRLGSCPF